jgi:hypothetical protein
VDSDGPSAGLEAHLDTALKGDDAHGPKGLLNREQPDGCSGRYSGSYACDSPGRHGTASLVARGNELRSSLCYGLQSGNDAVDFFSRIVVN